MSDILKIKAGEILIREGDASTEMYYLQSGSLSVVKQKGEETEVQIGIISEGELVGEMSFLDNRPRSATVRALDECMLVKIPRDKYEQVLNSNPKWMKSLLNSLIERLRAAKARIKI